MRAARFVSAALTAAHETELNPQHLDFDAAGYTLNASFRETLGSEMFDREYAPAAGVSPDTAIVGDRCIYPSGSR